MTQISIFEAVSVNMLEEQVNAQLRILSEIGIDDDNIRIRYSRPDPENSLSTHLLILAYLQNNKPTE